MYINRGNSYRRIGESDKAMADYDHAISINPNYAIAYRNRSLLHNSLGNREQAVKDMLKYRELGGE